MSTTNLGVFDVSDVPAAMRHLSLPQREQLCELLEQYLCGLEFGLPPSIEELAAGAPELLEPLRDGVSGLETLFRMAADDNAASSTPAVALSDDPHARQLGDFQLHEEIGRGGMGVVYRATQISLNRTVAIKLLPLTAVLDKRQLTRFRQEAEAAASLHHPHIVPVFALGNQRGVHFYAMQFIDGKSVEELIAERALGDWRQATQHAIQAAEGLHAAHELGIIHRDVKPSNLLVDSENHLWITDFGLARIQSDLSLTRTGDVVGTMRYMSPEQAHGQSAIVDGRTDVYSLGATLYEMLSLTPAHQGEDAVAILRMIDDDRVTPLRKLCPNLPRDLETVIAKAMASCRDRRYETAEAFAEDLRRVLAGESTLARPPSLVDRIARVASMYRGAVLTSALIGVLAFLGTALSWAKISAAKTVSDANALKASHHERIAREAIDRLGMQMTELLADDPAADAIRHRLLQETLNYYNRFAQEAEQDPSLARDLAMTYGKIGAFHAQLGASDEAIAALENSESLYRSLAQADQEDAELQLQWTISQNNLAERLSQLGRLDSASEWFEQAIRRQLELEQASLAQENGFQDSQVSGPVSLHLATTYSNYGLLLAKREQIDPAQQAYHAALDRLDDSPTHDLQRASVEANLAGLLAKQSPEAAILYAREALARQTAALELDPSNPRLATSLALTLSTLGTAQAAQSQHAAAIQTFGRAVEIGEQLHLRWPNKPAFRRDLALNLNNLGLSLSGVRKLREAGEAFQQAIRLGSELAHQFDTDAEMQSMLGGMHNNYGFVQQRLGAAQRAQTAYDSAVRYQQRAVGIAPEVRRYRVFLSKHQKNQQTLASDAIAYIGD